MITLVHTDVEGSTSWWERFGAAFKPILDLHNAALRAAIAETGGYEVRTEGDAFLVAYESTDDALAMCLQAQIGLHAAPWPAELRALTDADPAFSGLRVRMGIHRGEAIRRDDPVSGRGEWRGRALHHGQRVAEAAHGGQIVISDDARAALARPIDGELVDLGTHTLAGRVTPERLWQVTPGALPRRRFPPPRVAARRTNVERVGDLIGRDDAIASLGSWLEAGEPFVTLVGPGGIGKTELARHLVHRRSTATPGGAWLCEAGDVDGPDGICAAIARAMSLQLGGRDGATAVGEALAARGRLLLVIDDVVPADGLVGLAAGWREAAPNVQIVCTSRVPLGAPGELLLAIEPLATPEPGAGPDAIDASPAVRLLRARAAAIAPGVTSDDREALAALTRALDGYPLALELAAARMAVLTPAQLVERLTDRLEVLRPRRGEGSAALARALGDAWEALSAVEQGALSQAAVFRGGLSEAGARAVFLFAGAFALGGVDVADTLEALVRHGMLRRGDDGRYALLAVVRAHALDHAEPGDAAERRHAAWCASLKDDELLDDVDNVLAALGRAVARGDARSVFALVKPAMQAVSLRGPLARALDLGLRAARMDGLDPDERLHALGDVAWAWMLAGRPAAMVPILQEALAAAPAEGAPSPRAVAWGSLGTCLRHLGRFAEARAAFEAAIAWSRRGGDRHREGTLLGNLGNVLKHSGDRAGAGANYAAAAAILRDVGARQAEAVMLGNLAMLAAEDGRHDEAIEGFTREIAAHVDTRARRDEGIARLNLGLALTLGGRLPEALASFERAQALAEASGDPRGVARTLAAAAEVRARQGDVEVARRTYGRAAALFREVGDARNLERVTLALGQLDAGP